MADEVLFLCKYGEKTAVIRSGNISGYGDFMNTVCKKWDITTFHSLRFSYSIPGHSQCILKDDDDFNSMLMITSHVGIRCVDVVVVSEDRGNGTREDDIVGDYNNFQFSDNSEMDCESDLLPSYCPHKKKPLLSDEWAYGISRIGQCFEGGADEFREVLCKYAIKVGFDFDYVKNEGGRVSAKCSLHESRGCKWRVHCSVNDADKKYYIKKLDNVHTCGSYIQTWKNKRVSSDLVCQCIIDKVRVDASTRATTVLKYMKSDYGVEISYRIAWKALDKTKKELFGDDSKSFDDLRWYVVEALRKNPGSFFDLDVVEGEMRFNRLFFSFFASIYGFNYCRPMLFLDGTFLKGKYKGQLLSAVAKDGNQELFPLAYAIVDAENEDNWIWFLQDLRKIIDCDRQMIFISDRHNGLLEAIPQVFPSSHHGFCLNHLKANLRDKLRGRKGAYKEYVVDRFRDCAYEPTRDCYDARLSLLMKLSCKEEVESFLERIPLKHWSNAFFEGQRYGEMTSNAVESFNSFIKEARDLPVTKLVDAIRYKCMEKMAKSRKIAASCNSLVCPNIFDILHKALEEGRTWKVRTSDDVVYEVCAIPSVVVDIERCTCSCFQWQLNGYPCSHAAVVIQKSGRDLDDLIDPYFHVSNYRETYSESIHPIPTVGKEFWTSTEETLHPPNTKRQPGRPKKRRIPSRGEKVRTMKCGRCDRMGNHNRTTCNEPLKQF